MKMKKTVKFNQAELEAILAMSAIAGRSTAAGDYASWTVGAFAAARDAAKKAQVRLARYEAIASKAAQLAQAAEVQP
jgi:hypothetical protein